MCFQLSKQSCFVFIQQLCYRMIFVPLLPKKTVRKRKKHKKEKKSTDPYMKTLDFFPFLLDKGRQKVEA